MILIPKELYVGLQVRSANGNVVSADGGKHVALGFVSYKNHEGKVQHQESFDKWRDKDIPRMCYDNNPTTGFSVAGSVTRWSTSNKLIRVEDPRGFQFEIPVENFIDIIRECTIKQGIILDEMVIGWEDKVRLYKVGSDNYNLGIDNFELKGTANVSIKDIKIGSKIRLNNGKTVEYIGAWHSLVEEGWRDETALVLLKNFSIPRTVSTARYFYYKENGVIEKSKSLVVKRIIEEGHGDIKKAENELLAHIEDTRKYKTLTLYANEEITSKGLQNSYYGNDADKVKEIYNKYNLNDRGNNYLGVDDYRGYARDDVYAISDKPIKQDFVENLVKEIKDKAYLKV